MSGSQVIAQHRSEGRMFRAGGVESFVREEGTGPAVVCMHGVPASSFLYRKVLSELAGLGFRGVAFDLPGLGLAERPREFDYTWTGLGAWAASAVDALELERFHLVVHDIGGPVGFELAAALPDRIESLTILNTLVDVAGFKKPWSMRPFGSSLLGPLWLRTMVRPAFRFLMRLQGIANREAVAAAEIDAYVELLKLGDNGRAFLEIMRGFEPTPEKQALYRATLGDAPYPKQVIWGEFDPALEIGTFGAAAQKAAGVETIHRLPGKHFLQEDQAEPIARLVSALAGRSSE